MISQADYVSQGGGICPFCGYRGDMSYGGIEIMGINIYQDVSCPECEKSWTDNYALSGYTLPAIMSGTKVKVIQPDSLFFGLVGKVLYTLGNSCQIFANGEEYTLSREYLEEV